MTTDLESRLQHHLGQQPGDSLSAAADHDASLTKVRRIARNRTRRTRAAIGLCGLVAIAGLASVVPDDGRQSALVTAVEPEDTATRQIDATDPPDSGDDAADHASSPATVPPPRRHIMRGAEGGFVGVSTSSSTGKVTFAASVDGDTWTAGTTWQLPPDHLLESVSFVDETYVAVLDGDGDWPSRGIPLADPVIAVSTDLVNWEYLDLDTPARSPVEGLAPTRYLIGDIAVDGDDLAVAVAEIHDLDYDHYGITERDLCGGSRDGDAVVLTLCDGSRVATPGVDRTWETGIEWRIYHSRDGASAVPSPVSILHPPRTATPSFPPIVIDFFAGRLEIATLGSAADVILGRAPIEQLGDPTDHTLSAAEGRDREELLVIIDGPEGFQPVRLREGDVRVGTISSPVGGMSHGLLRSVQLRVGPAGWAALVRHSYDLERDAVVNGWTIESFSGARAWLEAEDATRSIWYGSNSSAVPPGVQVSMFGGARYFDPDSGELVAELQDMAPSLGRPDDAAIEVDGWRLSGDPIAGPLVLTSPSGDRREFADGYAFTNDDIDDGVEAVTSASPFERPLRSALAIRFYDENGEELVVFRGRAAFDALTGLDPGEPSAWPGFQPDPHTWVLFSADGLDWQTVWSNEPDDPSAPTDVLVGDDELVLIEGFEPRRIGLPD